jgi:WD40 repeat protein
MSPDGLLVALPTKRFDITLYDALTGQPGRVLKGHTNYLRSLEFDKESHRLVSSAADGSVRIWSVRTGEQLDIWYPLGKQRRAMIGSAILSPDGRFILAEVEQEPRFRVWSIKTHKDLPDNRRRDASAKTESAYGAAELRYDYMDFSPDGSKIVTVSRNGNVTVRNTTGAKLIGLVGHNDSVTTAVFSPDGQNILTASVDRTARIWSLGGKLLFTLRGHASSVKSAIYSPDGRTIATASADATIRLWDTDNDDARRTIRGHTGPIDSIAFSRDGNRLVTASMDTTVRVWEVQSGVELAELRLDGMLSTRRAQFGPDGRTVLAMAGYDAVLWKNLMTTKTPLQEVVDRAKREVPRCLTLSQRRAFDLPLSPPRWCVTGPGRERETDPSKWQPKWPYQTPAWKSWLIKSDRGVNLRLPSIEMGQVAETSR